MLQCETPHLEALAALLQSRSAQEEVPGIQLALHNKTPSNTVLQRAKQQAGDINVSPP